MNRKTRCVLDTETAGSLSYPLPYDFSYVIYQGKEMTPVCKKSFVIKEIFMDSKLMDSAYYREKIPSYWESIWAKEKSLVSAYEARQEFFNDLARFSCKECYAYNMAFDRRALNNLIAYVSDEKYKWFWKKGVKLYCIWAMAADCFLATRDYYNVATANNWVSEKGNIKSSAECAYRYITGNYGFIEEHKGLEDSEIEGEILKKCLSYHKKLDKTPKGGIWQKCQKVNRREKKKSNKKEIESKIKELQEEIKELKKLLK